MGHRVIAAGGAVLLVVVIAVGSFHLGFLVGGIEADVAAIKDILERRVAQSNNTSQ